MELNTLKIGKINQHYSISTLSTLLFLNNFIIYVDSTMIYIHNYNIVGIKYLIYKQKLKHYYYIIPLFYFAWSLGLVTDIKINKMELV